MSLISTQNLVAPLVSKRNLVSLIIVASFFIIYRAAGGNVESRRLDGTSVAPKSSVKSLDLGFLGRDTMTKRSPIDDINNLGVEKYEEDASRDSSNSKLDEIERSLGIR